MTSVVVVEVKSIKGECPKHGPKHAKHQVKMVNWSMTSVVVVVVVESIKGECPKHGPKHAKHQVKMVNWSMTSVVVVVVVVESKKAWVSQTYQIHR